MEAKKPRTSSAVEDDAINQLHRIQQQIQKVMNKEANETVLAIKKNYMQQRKLLYRRRNEIIREIPEFWLTRFMNHPMLQTLIMDEDKEIFHYLDSLNVEVLGDPGKGYCITFSFNANPFFENEKLTKTIKYSNGGTLKSMGTAINWKGGFTLLNRRHFHHSIFFSWFITPKKDTWEVEHDLVAELIKDEIWLVESNS